MCPPPSRLESVGNPPPARREARRAANREGLGSPILRSAPQSPPSAYTVSLATRVPTDGNPSRPWNDSEFARTGSDVTRGGEVPREAHLPHCGARYFRRKRVHGQKSRGRERHSTAASVSSQQPARCERRHARRHGVGRDRRHAIFESILVAIEDDHGCAVLRRAVAEHGDRPLELRAHVSGWRATSAVINRDVCRGALQEPSHGPRYAFRSRSLFWVFCPRGKRSIDLACLRELDHWCSSALTPFTRAAATVCSACHGSASVTLATSLARAPAHASAARPPWLS